MGQRKTFLVCPVSKLPRPDLVASDDQVHCDHCGVLCLWVRWLAGPAPDSLYEGHVICHTCAPDVLHMLTPRNGSFWPTRVHE